VYSSISPFPPSRQCDAFLPSYLSRRLCLYPCFVLVHVSVGATFLFVSRWTCCHSDFPVSDVPLFYILLCSEDVRVHSTSFLEPPFCHLVVDHLSRDGRGTLRLFSRAARFFNFVLISVALTVLYLVCAPLPSGSEAPGPPFSFVGCDCFPPISFFSIRLFRTPLVFVSPSAAEWARLHFFSNRLFLRL